MYQCVCNCVGVCISVCHVYKNAIVEDLLDMAIPEGDTCLMYVHRIELQFSEKARITLST